MERKIIALNIGRAGLHLWKGTTEKSAIGKKRVNEAHLTKNGFRGDFVANREVHGGPERAVCLYPFEHYQQWEREFNKSFQLPAFGENVCVENMLERDVYIGDTYSFGEAIIQVSQGRIPCATISKHNREDKLLKRVVETGYTGYFFRVLQEGLVCEDSYLKLLDRTQEKFSVLTGNHIMFYNRQNRKVIEEFLEVEELAEVWRVKFINTLNE
ncbi:MOSC domain-containing protein [Bacillus sp. FJAT-29790]|uniref:MOSC domain-containing protein n=1 Tax=Bacillus sp. FJAT-29790 TaxID=1895002 RepID=UPI001C23ED1B|nr:MOSC domain-containing protein [Bacillus sp. FJAT-29790]MBU8877993.1 MOSC domain-containing protein [Bacillus sp. FJAT-29790]